MTAVRALLYRLLVAAVVLAAANVLFLLARGAYDFHIGPLHLAGHQVFKPLLILNGTFLLAIFFGTCLPPETSDVGGAIARAILALTATVAFASSVTVNPQYDEWNYRGLSATYATLGDVARLFVTPQINSWYRPVGFLSLWLDHVAFHEHVQLYHLQNILLHLANVALAFMLAKRLGLPPATAKWAAVLYLTASVAYQPVLWPSARFDLLAMMFTSLALLASMRFLSDPSLSDPSRAFLWIALVCSLGCYILAVLSKESGYAFPALLAVLLLTRPSRDKRRIIPLGAGVLAVTGLLLGVRFAVLRGMGGYVASASAPSIHLSLNAATARSILTKPMQMSLLSVNLLYPTPKLMLCVVGAFALVLVVAVIASASIGPKQWVPIVYALAALLPVATLVSWLDANAQEVRYLYMPAAFVMMFVAVALSNTRWPVALLSAFGFLNLCCGAYNMWVYGATYQHARNLASAISREMSVQATPRLKIIGMPEALDGVLFSRFEFQDALQKKLPGTTISFETNGSCTDSQCYLWEPEQRTLRRFRLP